MSDRSGERTVRTSQEGRSEPSHKTERQPGRAETPAGPVVSADSVGSTPPVGSDSGRCRCESEHDAEIAPQSQRTSCSEPSTDREEFVFAAHGQVSRMATSELIGAPPGTPGTNSGFGTLRSGSLSAGDGTPTPGGSSARFDAGAPASTSRTGRRGAWLWKSALSLWLVYHFSGLLISPASIQPSSDLQRDAWLAVGPYLQFISMNQGNHFFAPDPGPSTLVTYVAERKDGSHVTGQIPDRKTMQPRLLYHRHFMLTEQLAGLADAVDLDVETSRRLFDLHLRAIARQVCRQHGAQQVTLSRVTHVLREPEWVQAGMPLQHPENYQVKPLGRFEWTDF